MTKKDYELVAAAIFNAELLDSQEAARELIAERLADVFKTDNERFDRERFLAAALGMTPGATDEHDMAVRSGH